MSLEHKFEKTLFASRWLLVPFYVGLVLSVLILLKKFLSELLLMFFNINTLEGSEVIVSILTLVDIALVANLMFIIIFSGYESFVSKINLDDNEDKPGWMGKVSFSALKIKVIGSIVAISAIELLKVYVDINAYEQHEIIWKVLIHLTFVVSGVLFAVMDRLSSAAH